MIVGQLMPQGDLLFLAAPFLCLAAVVLVAFVIHRYVGFAFLGLIAAAVLYIVLFSPSQSAFERVAVGSSEEAVVSVMGKPQHVERRSPWLQSAEYEYEYYLWPIPAVWCVGFKNRARRQEGLLVFAMSCPTSRCSGRCSPSVSHFPRMLRMLGAAELQR